jgi:hypothetical protein
MDGRDYVVAKGGTSVQVEALPAGLVAGAEVMVGARVVAQGPAVGTPTGVVRFTVDGEPVGNPVPVSGDRAVAGLRLGAGAHRIGAEYLGDDKFFGSTSASEAVADVARASTATSLALSDSVGGAARVVVVDATVTGPTGTVGTPSGEVTIYDANGVFVCGPLGLNGDGKARAMVTLNKGPRRLYAEYAGAADFAPSTSPVASLDLTGDKTTVELTASPTPSRKGQPVTLVASVTSVVPTGVDVGGLAQFSVDGLKTGDPVPVVEGMASIQVLSLSVGTHTMGVEYLGDMAFDGSASLPTVQLVESPGVVAAIALSGPVTTVGEAVTVSVDVVAEGDGASPTGRVQFEVDGVQTGAAMGLVAGRAERTVVGLAVGAHTIRAHYLGDSSHEAAWSGTATHSVEPGAVAVALTATAPRSQVGDTVTVKAAVEPVRGSRAPGGLVRFVVDGAQYGGLVGLDDGIATVALTDLETGAHTVRAYYLGDGLHDAGWSGTLTHTVALGSVTVGLTLSAGQSQVGDTVTLTALAEPVTGRGPVGGSVRFMIDGAQYGGLVALVGQRAVTAVMGLSVGDHSMRAEYVGDRGHESASSGTQSHVVVAGAVAVGLGASSVQSQVGTPVTLTASVEPVGPADPPVAGSVRFIVDGAQYGGLVAVSGGTASTVVVGLAVGDHRFQAEYLGDPVHSPSIGSEIGHTVLAVPAVAPAALSVSKSHNRRTGVATLSVKATAVVPGHEVRARKVDVSVNGKRFGAVTTDARGVAVVSIPEKRLRIGKNPVLFTYRTGEAGHTATVSITDIVTVTRVVPATVKTTTHLNKTTGELTVTVKTKAVRSGYSLRGQTVWLIVNGKRAIKAVTDRTGKAVFTFHGRDIPLLKNGTNTVLAHLKPGSDRYRPGLSPTIRLTLNTSKRITAMKGGN